MASGNAGSEPRGLVLIGFMGAGKTTVGARLAKRLGWDFRDADVVLEQRAGRSIADFFAAGQEPLFRSMEHEIVTDLVKTAERRIVATGGGWAADPDRVRALPDDVVSVWLRVSPELAVQRAYGEGPTRPLLTAPDPSAAAKALLSERVAGYSAADLHIDTDGADPDDLVERILGALALSELEH